MTGTNFTLRPYIMALMLVTLGASAFSYAQTDELKDEKFRLAGFATFAYAKLLDSSEGAIGNLDSTGEGDYRDFNKLGLRLDVDLDDKLSFATQILASGNGERTNTADYTPNFDWIYATYRVMPNLSVSVGRTTVPLFMYSDYLDTSYAYQWLVAPSSVYSSSGNIKSSEGIRVNWIADMGGAWSSDLTVWTGHTDEYIEDLSTDFTLENNVGIAWEVEHEWLTLRWVYSQGNSSASDSPELNTIGESINTGLESLTVIGAPVGADVTTLDAYQDVLWEDDKASFSGLGLALDFEHVFFVSELTRIKLHDSTAVADTLDSWYAMIGTRVPGNVSLSLTFSGDKNNTNGDDIAENLAGDMIAAFGDGTGGILDQSLAAIAQGTGDAINDIQFQKRKNITFSTRWDFHHSASLKFEYLRAIEQNNPGGDKRKPSAFMVGMDMVF